MTRADLKHCGKIPDAREEINRSVREGRIESRHRSSRGVKRKKHNLHSFIVASFNAQSVKGNDMACKRCEISTFIKDNGVDLFFCDRNMA